MKKQLLTICALALGAACAYAQDSLLSALPADASIDGTEELYCEDSGNTTASMCTVQDIVDLAGGGQCIDDDDDDTSVCADDDDYTRFRGGGGLSYWLWQAQSSKLSFYNRTSTSVPGPPAAGSITWEQYFQSNDGAGNDDLYGELWWELDDDTDGSFDGSYVVAPTVNGSTASTNSTRFRGGSVYTTSKVGIGDDEATSSACISNSSDRLYHDTDCDNSKDAGEEYIDQAGGAGDDQPDDDSEVPDDITVNNTSSVKTTGEVQAGGDIATDACFRAGDADADTNGFCICRSSAYDLLYDDKDCDGAFDTDGTESYRVTSPHYGLDLTDDFLGTNVFIGECTGTNCDSAASTSFGTGVNPGIKLLNTGSTSSGDAGHRIQTSNFALGSGDAFGECVVHLSTLSTSSERFEVRCGFDILMQTGSAAGAPTDAVSWYYRDDVNGGEWFAYCREASGSGGIDSNIAVATGVLYTLAVHVNAAASTATFYINGSSAGTCSTGDIPTVDVPFGVKIRKTVGNTNRGLHVEWLRFWTVFTTPR